MGDLKQLKIYTLEDHGWMYKYLWVETDKYIFLKYYGFDNIVLEELQGYDWEKYYKFIDRLNTVWTVYEDEIEEWYRFEAEYSYWRID